MQKIIRYTLVATAFGHFIEFGFALYEEAYITATLAIGFGIIEFIASTYLKK
mgnify:CR=1 FL=1|tara:strand:+ start:1084 stop:1239 length:156 start_codon:yes stop_codon:yes gene_type:complete